MIIKRYRSFCFQVTISLLIFLFVGTLINNSFTGERSVAYALADTRAVWIPHVCVNCPSGVGIGTHKGDVYVNGTLGNRMVQGGYYGSHEGGTNLHLRAAPLPGYTFSYWNIYHGGRPLWLIKYSKHRLKDL